MDRIILNADHLASPAEAGYSVISTTLSPGPPLLFGTRISGGKYDGYQRRHSTLAEAKIGHVKAIKLVKEG